MMKRFIQTSILVCVVCMFGAGTGFAKPDPNFGIEADQFCAANGLAVKAEFQPQVAGNCFGCHDDGDGGQGAGRTAFKDNDFQFFCAAPPVGDGPPPLPASGDLIAVKLTREQDNGGGAVELIGSVEEVVPNGLIIAGIMVDVSAFPALNVAVGQEVVAHGQYDPATGVLTASEIDGMTTNSSGDNVGNEDE